MSCILVYTEDNSEKTLPTVKKAAKRNKMILRWRSSVELRIQGDHQKIGIMMDDLQVPEFCDENEIR